MPLETTLLARLIQQDLLQAKDKRHSTIEEALHIAAACTSYRTVLTHFSQRYPHLPHGLPTEGDMAHRVVAAFDGMCISLPDLPVLAHLNPALTAMFEQQDLETE